MGDILVFRSKKDLDRLAGLILDQGRRDAQESLAGELNVFDREMRHARAEHAHSRAERAQEGFSELEREIFGPAIEIMFGGEL